MNFHLPHHVLSIEVSVPKAAAGDWKASWCIVDGACGLLERDTEVALDALRSSRCVGWDSKCRPYTARCVLIVARPPLVVALQPAVELESAGLEELDI